MQKNRLAVVRRTGVFPLVALGRHWAPACVALALAGAGVVALTPVAEAAPPISVDCSTMNLQTAINEASPGATLAVSGTCVGHFTIDGKALALVRSGNTATLDGGQTGTVLTITDGADVTLNRLTITHGSTANVGGGIDNISGRVTLNGSVVTGNDAFLGGGIFNQGGSEGGTLTLNGGSEVTGNSAEVGGGIYNVGTLTLNTGSEVSRNDASRLVGGGGIFNVGTLTLNTGSEVTGNSAANGFGGGIANGGTVTLNTGSEVSRNDAFGGGGIDNVGTLTLNAGGVVTENTAEFHGGGIYNFGILTGAVDGRNVRDNTPDNIFPPEG